MGKWTGSKKDREELTAALKDSETIRELGDEYEASQERIRKAEARLPLLGRQIGRHNSL